MQVKKLIKILLVLIVSVSSLCGNELEVKAKEIMLSYIATYHKDTIVKEQSQIKRHKRLDVKALFKRISKPKKKPNSKMWSLIKRYKAPYKKRILKAVLRYSHEFRIKPELLLSVLVKESSLYYKRRHPIVSIRVNNKKIKTFAIGLGGIIYEANKKILNKHGIYSRRVLWYPETNIKASAVILSSYMKMKIVRGARNRLESALMRYFGLIKKGRKYSRVYPKRIYKVLRLMT